MVQDYLGETQYCITLVSKLYTYFPYCSIEIIVVYFTSIHKNSHLRDRIWRCPRLGEHLSTTAMAHGWRPQRFQRKNLFHLNRYSASLNLLATLAIL